MISGLRFIVFAYLFIQFDGIRGQTAATTTSKLELNSSQDLNRSWTHTSTFSTVTLNITMTNLTKSVTKVPKEHTIWPPPLVSLNRSINNEIYDDYNSTDWPTVIEEDDWTSESGGNESSWSPGDPITTTDIPFINDTIQSDTLKSQTKGLAFDFNKTTVEEALGQGILNVREKAKTVVQMGLDKMSSFVSVPLEQIKSYPADVWASVKEKVLKTLDSNQSASVLDKIQAIGDWKTWRKLFDILKEKLPTNYIIDTITNKNFTRDPNMNKRLVQTVSDRLGDYEHWNESTIENLGPSVMLLNPYVLMSVNNKAAMVQIFNYLADYLDSSPDRPELVAQTYSVLSVRLAEAIFGSIPTWDQMNRTVASVLPIAYPLNIKQLKQSCVQNSTEVIGAVNFYDRTHAQPLIEMIMRDVNLSALTKDSTRQLINSLGGLTRHLRLQDVKQIPKHAFDDVTIGEICSYNDTRIDKELGKWFLSISKPREDDWSQKDVTRLRPLLGFANAHTLSELATKNLLDGPTIKTILQNQHLDKSQVRAIANVATKEFKKGDKWDLDTIPAIILTIISSGDFKKMKNEDIIKHMDKFNSVAKFMSPAQTIAIAQKIEELKLGELAQMKEVPRNSYLSLVTFDDTENQDELKKILINMPIDSPQVLNYVNDKWMLIANNVTTDDFRNDLVLLKSLTCEMLDYIGDDQITDLLRVVSDTNCALQIKTSICVAEKLKRHLSKIALKPGLKIFKDEDDEIRLLSVLSIADLSTVGGQNLLQFSAMSLQEQSPKFRCEFVFSLIGQVPLKVLNLLQPPEKKRQIARAALNCLGKSESPLNSKDAYVIGNLVGYLPETVLSNMETNALIVSLPYINGKVVDDVTCDAETSSDLKPPPCLTANIRNTLRHKLNNAFGSPSSWDETVLRSIGCLLSTLYPEQLNQIPNDAILSVADELVKCWNHQSGTSSDNVYATLCKKELPLSTTMMMEESSKQLKRRLTEAALQATEMHARVKRDSTQMVSHPTCDSVSKVGPALMVMTDKELESLSPVSDCLDDLGRHPMSNSKAVILWNKIKKESGKSAANTDITTYESMGYIAQGLTVTELSTLTLKEQSHIAVFGGQQRNFSTEQLKVLAKQVLVGYQSNASQWTADDLVSFGYVLCGFPQSDIDNISADVYAKISRLLNDVIATCPLEIRQSFARKAVMHYGPVMNWTSTVITSIGPALGGLTPSQLAQVPGHSFQAVAVEWVKTIPLESMKVLHREQFGNLSVEAASNFSPEQLNQLSVSEMEVINQIKGIPSCAQPNVQIRSLLTGVLLLPMMLMINS